MALRKRVFLPPLIIAFAITVVVVLSSLRPQPPMRSMERPAVLVEVLDATPTDVRFTVDGQGNVMPKRTTDLVAQVSGRIIELSDKFVDGGFFERGEVLLKIDPADYQVALQSAQAQLAQAKAALAEESARAQVAREEWESLQMGEIPALGIREPQVAAAVANVQSAEAGVARARRDLERTEIRAPYAGLLQNKSVDLGQYVSMNSQVGTLMGTEVAEIRVPLSDRDLAYLNLPDGDTDPSNYPLVEVTSNIAGEMQRWLGRMVRSEGILDSSSRVIYGVVQIDDPYNQNGQTHPTLLRFGRFVQLSIEGSTANDVFEVPRYALTTTGKLWVVDEERRLQSRDVSVLRADDNLLYIDSGLNRGDKVVLTQLSNALPSMKVRLPGDPVPKQQETPTTPAADTEVAAEEQKDADNDE
ncbi:MAG TPA: efflux RND transporter periplasmic adaptor subunit [Pseudidiomarina sp.]|nr:efflux RND transporter periplasmic adaptor subunit [Pseudidiomarina sp.]